jgi:membrane protein involved in colicin uptake
VSLSASKSTFLAVALALFAASAAAPQSSPGQSASRQPEAKAAKIPTKSEKAELIDATRVSTEEAARRAAEKKAEESAGNDSNKKENAKEDAAAVSEFKPAAKTKDSGTAVQPAPQDSGKLPLKDIHGSVQGAGGGGMRRGGAEIGASSKGGKTHVYVETERSRSDAAPPH